MPDAIPSATGAFEVEKYVYNNNYYYILYIINIFVDIY